MPCIRAFLVPGYGSQAQDPEAGRGGSPTENPLQAERLAGLLGCHTPGASFKQAQCSLQGLGHLPQIRRVSTRQGKAG